MANRRRLEHLIDTINGPLQEIADSDEATEALLWCAAIAANHARWPHNKLVAQLAKCMAEVEHAVADEDAPTLQ